MDPDFIRAAFIFGMASALGWLVALAACKAIVWTLRCWRDRSAYD